MKKSFSLIEVVISVAILAMFLGALLALSSIGSRSTESSERRIQSANLAREPLEMTRQIRDTAVNKGVDPFTTGTTSVACFGLSNADINYLRYTHLEFVTGVTGCTYGHWRLTPLTSPPAGTALFEKIVIRDDNKTDAGLIPTYNLVDVGEFGFARRITVTNVGALTKSVVVSIYWFEGTIRKNIQMRTALTKWN